MKFTAGFVVYIVYASWWASGISTGVEANARHSAETLVVLKEHMKECATMHERIATVEATVKDNKTHIDLLNNAIFVPRLVPME